MVSVFPWDRVRPLTVIVCPETLSVPAEAVVQPIAFVVTGAVQPVGTATVTAPALRPPWAAVYVN
jgi:hypothetical protein